MRLLRPSTGWRFSASNIVSGAAVAAPIPRLNGALTQTFSASVVVANMGGMDPAPSPDRLAILLDANQRADATSAQKADAVHETHALENPTIVGTGFSDCASCHVAERARSLAGAESGILSPQRYQNAGHVLTSLPDGHGLGSQRAFGYFERTPSTSSRVVHESAIVADWVNAAFAGRR
jgi:hypothetical protein